MLAAHEVIEPLHARFALHHLEPSAAESVVDQKLDDISRGEELVADGELAAVAGGLAGFAHGAALVLAVKILVDPTDRLVLDPHRGELGGV